MVTWIKTVATAQLSRGGGCCPCFSRRASGFPDGLDTGCGQEEGSERYRKGFTSTDGWMESPSAEMEEAVGGS